MVRIDVDRNVELNQEYELGKGLYCLRKAYPKMIKLVPQEGLSRGGQVIRKALQHPAYKKKITVERLLNNQTSFLEIQIVINVHVHK